MYVYQDTAISFDNYLLVEKSTNWDDIDISIIPNDNNKGTINFINDNGDIQSINEIKGVIVLIIISMIDLSLILFHLSYQRKKENFPQMNCHLILVLLLSLYVEQGARSAIQKIVITAGNVQLHLH